MDSKMIIALIGLLMVGASIILPHSIPLGKILSIYGVLSVAYPIVKSLKTENYHITIVFVFMMGFLLVPFNYFWVGLHINSYGEVESLSTVYTVLQILCLFHAILLYKIRFSAKVVNHAMLQEKNNTVFYILLVVSFLFVTFGSSGKSIFEAGSYAESLQVRQSSSFFAYAVIPISLSYIYADTKRKRTITYAIVAFFCLKDLAFGGRVDSLELLLSIFFLRIQYLWSRKMIFMAATVGALFFFTWGIFRGDVNVGFANALSESIGSIGVERPAMGFQTGTSAEVYYSSIRIIYMIEHEVLTATLRIESCFYFFLSSLVPYSMLPDVANLSAYLQNIYWSGGGGLAPVFFYAFGSWVGVILFSIFVAYCINLFLKHNSSKYIHFYAVLLFATTPRWYAYYPIQIIKFCVVGALLYYIIDSMFRKKVIVK